ncbi:choline dehydrogenase [Tateyamaria omphalii]|uniref:GMC family oxidoreductase n=1 Tax=Tateyamaria omphalii TaxID=299262 RepID=UPI001982D292|nr:GMC family oxidoreductase N-terminal domain-containing protein [Tateyamaria omphalii]GGX68441.1 choline dehydrogenase [Tateyamaria omphalii]
MTNTKMNRRDFMRKTSLASGVLLVAPGIYGASVNTAQAQTGAFDYIICGAGSAGCVLAHRLTENEDVSVLIIEAGGPEEGVEAISTPLRLLELWNTEYDWAYFTAPQKHCNGRNIHWPRGKVVGGSGSLNGMLYVRGHATDYDNWAYQGNPGWDYESVLPYFKKSEDFDGGENEYHGVGGPLHVTTDYERHPTTQRIVEACIEAGYKFNEDYNGADTEGVNFAQMNTKDGQRHSSAVAFLRPALERSNLSLLTNSRVKKVNLDGKTATGVTYIQDGEERVVTAKREVILAGGTIESPKMLMLSGIGERAQLEEHGIEVVHDLPGVGKNLHDHSLAPVIYEGDVPPPTNLAVIPLHAQAFMRSDPRLPAPDMQPLFFHVPLYTADTQEAVTPSAYTLCAGGVSPTSRGELRLTGPNVDDPLMLDPNLLETQYDVRTIVENIKMMREVAKQPALAEITTREIYPGPEVQTDEELADYARNSVQSYHHQVGTCKMGNDEFAVVDHELRVHGLEGLRVVDASIMPVVPTGNTNAPTYMIAEKGADMIKESA